jgi:hypothetical protein
VSQVTWKGFTELPARGRTDVALSASGYGGLMLFAKGIDDREIYQIARDTHGWGSWTAVPGSFRTELAPATAANGPLMLVAVQHAIPHKPLQSLGKVLTPQPVDGSIHYNMFNAGQWSGWRELPGMTTHAGVAVSGIGPGYQVFAVGGDQKIYGNVGVVTPSSASWTGWTEVRGGALTASAPSVVRVEGSSWKDERIYLFHRGLDNHIRGSIFTPGVATTIGTWSAWSEVPGGGLTDAGLGACWLFNHVALLAKGLDNRIYLNLLDLDRSAWSGWHAIGPDLTSAPIAAIGGSIGNTGFQTLEIFTRGINEPAIYTDVATIIDPVQPAPTRPRISFTATPDNISVGDKSTLAWHVSDGDVRLVGQDGPGYSHLVLNIPRAGLNGSLEVVPVQTVTRYTLTAQNAAGSTTAEQVVVLYAPYASGLPVFYFRMTNPESWADPCFAIAVAATEQDAAKSWAETTYGGYSAEVIDEADFANAC